MIRLLILAAAAYAAIALVNRLAPGPGEADIRGPAKAVGSNNAEVRHGEKDADLD